MANANRPTDPAAATSAAAASTASAAPDDARSVNDDIADLKRELAKLSDMIADMAQSRYDQYRQQAAGIADDLSNRGTALRDEAYARAGALEEEMQRTVRERPLTAVAVAAGIGYLIGLVSRSGR